MAAKEDNESHQEFPVASFPIPSRAELEERVVLALNSKDGQQSCVQDGADPYTKAVNYVEKHRIIEVFQVSMDTKHSYIWQYILTRVCAVLYTELTTSNNLNNGYTQTPHYLDLYTYSYAAILKFFHRLSHRE